MRIVLDARSIVPTENGLGNYAKNLVRALAELDRSNEYLLLKRTSYPQPIVEQENFREMRVPYDITSFQNWVRPLPEINKMGADVFHSLNQFFPRNLVAKRKVVTVHDLMWVANPYLSHSKPWAAAGVHFYANLAFADAFRRADHVVAISGATRTDLLDHYRVEGDRVTVVHHGVGLPEGKAPSEKDLPEPLRGTRYVLTVGNTRPYKNMPRVLDAFARLGSAFENVKLVIAGRGDRKRALARQAEKLGVSGRVLFFLSVPEAVLRSLYGSARFLAIPSLCEGFGLPILEAMRWGCPVLTSRRPPMSEVAGEASLLVDARDVGSIAAGMRTLLSDDPLREELIRRGRARVKQFTWAGAARKTLDIYRRAIAAPPLVGPGRMQARRFREGGVALRRTFRACRSSAIWFVKGLMRSEPPLEGPPT